MEIVNELLGFVKRVGSVPNIPLTISKAARAPFAEASVVRCPSKDEVEFTVIFHQYYLINHLIFLQKQMENYLLYFMIILHFYNL